ncbi:hypothetical protein [Raoultella ornithinolytica]|uniref:hypothetical protein n=3 Tax=Klebsiella/Raoultella group TaxID=2890311 RepID=UPI001D0D3B41|nr:hypothetical protein [Raoultella ornithinolytica]
MLDKYIAYRILLATIVMAMPILSSGAGADNAEYTEKRRLNCMLVDQNIILGDSPAIGSFSAGWLRRIDTTWQQFASIEIDGWYVRAYGADNFSDAEGTIYAKDLDQSEVLFNRKNGVATISFPLQDGRTMLKKWRCDTGPDITK